MTKVKVENVTSLQRLFRQGDYPILLKQATKTIKYYEEELGKTKVMKARVLRIQGRGREASRLLSPLENSPSLVVQACAYLERGHLEIDNYREDREPKELSKILEVAHGFYNKALVAARDARARPVEMEAQTCVARILTYRQRYNQALRMNEEALQFFEKCGHKSQETLAKRQLVQIYLFHNRIERASELAKGALKTSKIRQDKRGIAHSYTSLADIDYQAERIRAAIEKYEHALILFEKLEEKVMIKHVRGRIVELLEVLQAEG